MGRIGVRTVRSREAQRIMAAVALLAAMPTTASAQRMINGIIQPMPGGGGGANGVPLPYTIGDNAGTSWVVQRYGGWLQQQGNQPVFSQAGMLVVDGTQINANLVNGARRDEKTGEIVLENLNGQNVSVTRRILFKLDEGYARIVDVVKNTQGQERTINFTLTTNLNYGVMNGEFVADPKKKSQNIAWLAMTHGQRATWEMFAAKGSKVVPTINWQQNNNTCSTTFQLKIPAGKSVGIVHLHGTAATTEQGSQTVLNMKDARLLADLPLDIRRTIVNWPTAQGLIGDVELLRGDLLDVVEIRGGDQMRGTIKDTSYKIDTFYGSVELPADRIVGMLSVGQFKPMTLLVTTDGEIYGGTLASQSLKLELSSGQSIQVPIAQVTRVGYRKRTGEPDEWKLDKPMVMLRSGDRVRVLLPQQPIDFVTRYGPLKLDPKSIASMVLQDDEQPVHQIRLVDGSKLSGVVVGDGFPMQLAGAAASKGDTTVTFPASSVRLIQFGVRSDEPDDAQAKVDLAQDDELMGTLTGKLQLETSFDTLTINAPEIRTLTRQKDSAGSDVQIVLWDGTNVSGRLKDPMLAVKLDSGAELSVPLGLVDGYTQPAPQPAAGTVEQIKSIVAELSAEDWKQRDRAEARLVEIGPVVTAVLKKMSPTLPPEAQQRVDSVLKQLEKQPAKPKPAAPATPNVIQD